MKKIPSAIRHSIQYAFSVIAGASTVAGIWGYTIRDISEKISWWQWLLIIVGAFILLSIGFYFCIRAFRHRSFSTKVNGKTVVIKTGDLFESEGWKLIPCNERFDTQVDDVIIAHNTLNGQMIDHHISDLEDLKTKISFASNDTSPLKGKKINGRIIYPLGRVIPYDDFLMLAFSHFDEQNQAYIGIGEYEQLLIRMWAEIRRVYAAKPITIPLIGAGITNVDGMPEKDYTEFLKCMLCTLRSSKFQPDKGITIVVTAEAMDRIDMNAIREEF